MSIVIILSHNLKLNNKLKWQICNYDSLIADVYDEEPVVELERGFFTESDFVSTTLALRELGLGHNIKIGC